MELKQVVMNLLGFGQFKNLVVGKLMRSIDCKQLFVSYVLG